MDTPSDNRLANTASENRARAMEAHALALRSSEGSGVPQDWNGALNRLVQASQLGHVLARRTLAGLAGDWALSHRMAAGEAIEADWQSLRERIDLKHWAHAPEPRPLSASPRIGIIEGLASAEVCDWLIARAKEGLVPARVYNPATGGPEHHGVRTNSERYFTSGERDLILNFVRLRIARACGLPVATMEAPVILNYTPGQQFLPHHDYFDNRASGFARSLAEQGQRVLTLLLCLNDDYEGGETEFPALGRRFKGRKGNALFFWNVEPEGMPDPRTLHAGLPPRSGEKWMLSQWIRDRAWRDPIA